VVAVGLTLGFALVEVNPAGLLTMSRYCHLQLFAPIVALLPEQIVVLEPVLQMEGFTVIVTLFDLVQPVAVIVSVMYK